LLKRKEVDLLITKYDDKALKAQRMMTEAQQAMVAAHNECLSSVRALLREDQNGRDEGEEEQRACKESGQPETEDVTNEEQDQNNTIVDSPQQANETVDDNDHHHNATGHESPLPDQDDGALLSPSCS
jgi:hypothetical protein